MPTIPTPPADYTPPTEKDFVAGFSGALSGINTDWAKNNLSPPVASTIPVLKTVVATVAKTDFGSIVAALNSDRISKEQIANIVKAVSGLVEGSLDIVMGMVDAATKQALSGAASTIPVLGAVITAVVGNIVMGVQAEELRQELAQHVEEVLNQQLHEYCGGLVESFRPYPTGADGSITPADFFRRVAFSYSAWKKAPSRTGNARLPLDGAAMYVMLCGGESQGFGITREKYVALVKQAKAGNPKIGTGIPQDVQRQMWKLIQGIMASVSDPVSSYPVGDQGLSLMPILQDVVREYYIRASEKGGPGWDVPLAQLLSDEVSRNYRLSYHEDEEQFGGAGVVFRESSCMGLTYGAGRHVDLSQPLLGSVIGYQAALLHQFYDAGTGKWKLGGKPAVGGFGGGVSKQTFVITPGPVQMRQAANEILAPFGDKKSSGDDGLVPALVVGAVAGLILLRLRK